jgi:hypothetical protein
VYNNQKYLQETDNSNINIEVFELSTTPP